jgi:hypothetical protein
MNLLCSGVRAVDHADEIVASVAKQSSNPTTLVVVVNAESPAAGRYAPAYGAAAALGGKHCVISTSPLQGEPALAVLLGVKNVASLALVTSGVVEVG